MMNNTLRPSRLFRNIVTAMPFTGDIEIKRRLDLIHRLGNGAHEGRTAGRRPGRTAA